MQRNEEEVMGGIAALFRKSLFHSVEHVEADELEIEADELEDEAEEAELGDNQPEVVWKELQERVK